MADDQHTGGMIALVPDDPGQLAVAGGDSPDQLHLTLAFLGDDISQMSDATRDALKAHVAAMSRSVPPIDAHIMGHALWNPEGGPDGDRDPCAVYQVQHNPRIADTREYALEGATRHLGADMPEQHPGFLPHVTAGYGITPDVMEYAGPVRFSTLRLALGNENHDFPLAGDSPSDEMAPGRFAAKTAAKPAVAEAPPEADAEPPALDADNGIPVTFPVIIVEGMATSDGRFIEPGSLSHRALPLPILAQTRNPEGGDGHAGADVIGRLDTLERVPGEKVVDKETGKPFPKGVFVWTGKGFIDPDAAGTKLAQKGYLTGNSADLSDVEAEFVWGDDENAQGPEQVRMTAGKIAATTLVPIPAFAQAYVTIDGEDMQPNETALAASASPAWVAAELGDDCFLCAAGIPAGFAAKKVEQVVASAAVKSMLPPAHAFADPVLPGLTPLTLDEHSIPGYIEITGHLAGWGTCHVGFAGQCVTPPKSRFDYGYFNVGAVRAHDAGEVKVVAAGHITMGEGGHAGMSLSADDAAAFYDNVNTVVADVAAGEDQFGIWVHGVVRRSATPEQVEALRAAPLSGDWRTIEGSLELVAALAVNSGGFPIPRARVASGAPLALVAAGVVGRDESKVEPDISEAFVEKVAAALQTRYQNAAQAEVLKAKGSALRAELFSDLRNEFYGEVEEIRASFLDDRREVLEWELEFGASDADVELAKKGNWVSKSGGLPPYIKRIAKHLQEKGMEEGRAIATAKNAAKKMCDTGDVNFPGKQDVNPGSRAEACTAIAQWEKKRKAA
jgi:2'-5' RNA ligase